VRLNAFEPEALTDPIISNLAKKCEVYIDDQVDEAFPLKRMAHLTVELRGIETIDFMQETRKGAPDDPMSDEELEDKYFELVSPEVDLDVAQKLLDDIWRIEKCDNIQDLCIAPNR